MNKKKFSRVLLLLFITSNLLLLLPPSNLIPNSDEIDLKSDEKQYKKENAQSSSLSNASNVIVFFNKSWFDKSAILNFTYRGGFIKVFWNNTFTSLSGFAGTIPNKNITSYLNNVTDATMETNEIIEVQMSYATVQTGAINSTWYLTGYKGNTNASIAVIDSGVNSNHQFFPNGFNQTNLSGNIVVMQNFVEGASTFDDNGHGTFISSVISGTGTDSEKSSMPIVMNLHGNLSHEEFFDSLSPQNYSIKICSFNVSKSNSNIFINSSCNYQPNEINGFWFELHNSTNLVNHTQNMTINKYYTINHTTFKSGQGVYDLYVKYHKVIQKKPTFSFNASVHFYPESYAKNYTYFTGITNATRIASYKILNQSGIGYASDLISALASVIYNKSKYHIVSVCLSIGTLGSDVQAVNRVINEVIENGTLVVIAAGNAGIEGVDPLNKLALNKNSIVVGAINDNDQITTYSSMGKSVGNGVYKPDIVAPGGSQLPGHRSIVAADAKSNKTTAAFGTSIAAAIVSAAINILIEARFVNWTEWTKLNMSNWVKTIKSTLLMTASETNLQREDDPFTDVDESNFSPTLYSPLLGIGLKDVHEGYGRINVQAAIDALTKYLGANSTVNGSLASSANDPLGSHVFARRITLTANKQYLFNLTNMNAATNFDLLLFSNESDQYGEPILLESSRKIYGNFNYLYFTPKENETECVITVKAINGKNTFKLNISAVKNIYKPVLSVPEVPYAGGTEIKNATVMSNQELLGEDPKYNYTIDRYQFFIEYSDNDTSNAPPQEVYVHIDGLNLNYSLDIFNALQYLIIDLNYTNGVVYASGQIQFEKEGNYSYYFVASDGPHRVIYPEIGVLNISIVFPTDSKQVPYIYNFTDGFDDWTHTGTGWNILTQKNSNDDRSRLYPTQWKSVYFGTYNNTPVNYTYQPIMIGDPYPNGTLISPLFNLTQLNETMRPHAKFGLRASINSGDSVELQVNLNWTGWSTLRTYTNQETEWFVEEINLTEYIGYYVQFRFFTSLDNNFDPINYKGFILDYCAIENRTNNNPPEIIDPSLDISPTEGIKFQKFTFSITYYDIDDNYPKYVYLEMNGINYTMLNIFGDWNAKSNSPGDKGILFVKTLVIDEISNRSFRFHISDGMHAYKTQWYNHDDSIISFVEPKPSQFNFVKSKKNIGRVYSSDSIDDYYISGTPMPKESTSWLLGDNAWHPIVRLGTKYLYGGLGQSYGGSNQGYGTNWDMNLITYPLQLVDEYNVYLEFYYDITLQNEFGVAEDLLDKCVISISKDYGESWITLKEYIYTMENLSGSEKIDISEYSKDIVMIKFTLHSNDIATGLGYGWLLRDIYVGYDTSLDFVPPEIKIHNPANNQTVNSTIIIEANISDNVNLDLSRFQIYINDESVNRSAIDFNNKTGVLKFEWNTLLYADGTYTIKVVAFDKEGNRAEQSITVVVNNLLTNWLTWGPWLLFFITIVVIGFSMYYVAEKKGEIWIKQIRAYRAEKIRLNGIDKDQVIKRIELIEPEEELKRPQTLYCKFCKSWFSSSDFKIVCPVCEHDQLYAAYNCMNCENWYFKEEPNEKYYCKKCESVRLVRREKEDIQQILSQKGIFLREYEDKNKKFSILDL